MKTLWLLLPTVVLFCSCTTPAPPTAEQPEKPPETTEIEPEPEEQPTEQPEEQFVVTDEVYIKTFDEIEEFIRSLNDIIRKADYQTWLTYLSQDYIDHTGDPEYLKEQSQQPLLKKSNISLKTLRDYFDHVVVPSRVQAELDEIEFIDENQVKAYAVIKNTKALLYLLVHENGKWKIGVW